MSNRQYPAYQVSSLSQLLPPHHVCMFPFGYDSRPCLVAGPGLMFSHRTCTLWSAHPHYYRSTVFIIDTTVSPLRPGSHRSTDVVCDRRLPQVKLPSKEKLAAERAALRDRVDTEIWMRCASPPPPRPAPSPRQPPSARAISWMPNIQRDIMNTRYPPPCSAAAAHGMHI
jgi:hypothetical protein